MARSLSQELRLLQMDLPVAAVAAWTVTAVAAAADPVRTHVYSFFLRMLIVS